MKLISEHIEQDLGYTITEGKSGEKNVFIEGVFMQANKKNRNNRIYEKTILQNAVSKYVQEQVSTGRAVGELNHPDGPTINLDKVSHRITELNWESNDVVGKALILDTPMGKIVKGLVEGGVKMGVSSRGMGTVEMKDGVSRVNHDFVLSTVDIVQDPSAPGAFVNGIMEGVDWVWDNGQLTARQIEEYETEIKRASSAQLAEAQKRVFQDFLSKL